MALIMLVMLLSLRDLVNLALESIVLKKASSPDNLYPLHFYFGPIESLAEIWAPLFQAMLSLHYVPLPFLQSYIIP